MSDTFIGESCQRRSDKYPLWFGSATTVVTIRLDDGLTMTRLQLLVLFFFVMKWKFFEMLPAMQKKSTVVMVIGSCVVRG